MNSVYLELDDQGHGATKSASGSLISQLIAACPRDRPFDALALLDQYPQLRKCKSAMLDLAYEEFCRRQEAGESLDVEKFAEQFPAVSRSLLHLVEMHRVFAECSGNISGAADLRWPIPGQVWLNFQLLEELGRGAFSRVYLARDQSLGQRLVVVKATLLEGGEAEILGLLQHRDIVPVHSVDRDKGLGLAAIVMPYLSRASLLDIIDAVRGASQPPARAIAILDAVQRLNAVGEAPEAPHGEAWPRHWGFLEGVVTIGEQLASALEHAHSLGILHCDVKPSNILITNDGRTKLLDFNLASWGGQADPLIGGTLPYMAPELVRYLAAGQQPASEELDRRIDIFGLGVTLFELAYGQYPFGTFPANKARADAAEQLWEAQRAGPTLPAKARTRVDRSIEEMLLRCLEFEPDKRPQTMAELSEFFRTQLQPSRQVGRWLRAHRRWTNAAATIACGGAMVTGAWVWAREPFPVREWRKGQACYQAGADAAAVEHLTAALTNDSHLVDARFLRACAGCRQKDYAAAFADFELLSKETSDGRPLAGMAHVVAAWQKDYRRAGMFYDMAVERGGDSPLLLNNLGYCLIEGGQFLKAKDFLRRALAGNPQLSATHHNLARAELMLAILENRAPDTGEIERALQFCPETAELDLDASRIYAIRANLAAADESENSDLDKMFEFLERAADRGATVEHLTSVLLPRLPPDSALRRDDRWALLEARAPIGTDFTRAVLLLDPLDELQSSRTGALSDASSPK